MKRILFQAAFMLLSTTVSAQDVIVKKNGEEIRAKVEEVGEQSIRYRKFTNLTGPVYSIACQPPGAGKGFSRLSLVAAPAGGKVCPCILRHSRGVPAQCYGH